MLLSHEKKFIFIKTFKTAGTSLEFALASQLGKKAIVTPQGGEENSDQRYTNINWVGPRKFSKEVARAILNRRSRIFFSDVIKDLIGRKGPISNIEISKEFDHIQAFRIKALIGETRFNEYFKIAVCRNPYEQMVSLYFWRMFERKRSVPPLPQISFDEWLASNPISLLDNQKMLTIDGKLVVDFVIHFETLKEDLARVCSKMNFDYEEVLRMMETKQYKSVQRPKGDAGDRKNIISPESKAAIDFFMDWDFKTFGYEKVL